MKKPITLCWYLGILFAAGCSKPENQTLPIIPMTYDVAGFSDMSIKALDSKSLVLDVIYKKGSKESVSLSFINLPPNIAAKIEPATGIPPFKASITITSKDTTIGKFPIKLQAKQANGTEKLLESTLSLYHTCVEHIPGSYTAQFYSGTFESEVTISDAEFNKIHVTGLYRLPECDVIVNCKDGILTIPKTTFRNGTVIHGYGRIINNNEFVIQHFVEENKYDVYSAETTFKRK